jgi:hypothetical protein
MEMLSRVESPWMERAMLSARAIYKAQPTSIQGQGNRI